MQSQLEISTEWNLKIDCAGFFVNSQNRGLLSRMLPLTSKILNFNKSLLTLMLLFFATLFYFDEMNFNFFHFNFEINFLYNKNIRKNEMVWVVERAGYCV